MARKLHHWYFTLQFAFNFGLAMKKFSNADGFVDYSFVLRQPVRALLFRDLMFKDLIMQDE